MEKEFVPVVDTDELSYKILSEQNADLLNYIKNAMAAGATAELIERWARWRFHAGAVIDLAIGAAHYIERAGKVE